MRFWPKRKREEGGLNVTGGGMLRRCPVCRDEGRRSEVVQDYGDGCIYGFGGHAFYDGRGDLHTHGGEWGSFWRCSRGHRWMQTGTQSCDACGRLESPTTIVLHDEEVRWI